MASIPDSLAGSSDWAWEVATLYPQQGDWSTGEYLSLTETTNRLIEFTDGRLEFLAMPTIEHQLIVIFLLDALRAIRVDGKPGMVLIAPYPTTIMPNKIREPDLVFKLPENVPSPGSKYFEGADLIIEVVSPDKESRKRDYETKAVDYAEAKIPEYWIVDPQQKQITVLTLDGDKYATHGVFAACDNATSKLLADFSVDTSAVFAAAKG